MFQPTIKEFADKQKEVFDKKLEKKTGWGRNEIKMLLLESTSEALAELLSEGSVTSSGVIPNLCK